MRRNIQNNYINTNIRPIQTSRNYNVYSSQQNQLNLPNTSNIQTAELSQQNQSEQSGLNDQVTDQQNIQSQEIQETNNPSQEANMQNEVNASEDFRLRQINVTNRLKGVAPTARINNEIISVPSLVNETNKVKNIKFNINEDKSRNNNIRNKFIETTKEKICLIIYRPKMRLKSVYLILLKLNAKQ